MENTEKFTTSKQVLAYIAECFPNCFTLEGEARPLKIGIFFFFSERLSDDPKVSKTQLRSALRQYTSSWRYLYGVKPGASRVDLDGNACGDIEQEHIDHAQKALAESKAKVAERRKEQNAKKQQDKSQNGDTENRKTFKSSKPKTDKTKQRSQKPKNTKLNNSKSAEPVRALSPDEIVEGKDVKLNMGKGNMPATIVEVNKDGVRVRLSNGLTMQVKAEHLCS